MRISRDGCVSHTCCRLVLLAVVVLVFLGGSGCAGETASDGWITSFDDGEGWNLQVLSDNRAIAAFFTYSPDGTKQSWSIKMYFTVLYVNFKY